MNIENLLAEKISAAFKSLFDFEYPPAQISFQKTKTEFKGDITLVVFPFVKAAKLNPEQTAQKLGEWLVSEVSEIAAFNVVKGFLNLEISSSYWLNFFAGIKDNSSFGLTEVTENSPVQMVEYCGPNTNKPLHLGHIRNCLLGFSVCVERSIRATTETRQQYRMQHSLPPAPKES